MKSVSLPVLGMKCANCANTVERVLNKVDGVLEVTVNIATERATVKFIPGVAQIDALKRAVADAGYVVIETAGLEILEDAEQQARQEEIARQRRLLIVGLLFTTPAFLLSMLPDFGVIPDFAASKYILRRDEQPASAWTAHWGRASRMSLRNSL